SELYKKGDEVQAKVLTIDKENGRFGLGIKQLTKDPWEEIPEKYEVGIKITGKVTNITDFGIFVELEEGIEGLIHSSEISKGKSKSPLGKFQIDDVIEAIVVNVSKEEKKIGLSIKKLQEKDFKETYRDYKNSTKEASTSFGMLIKEKMEANAALNSKKEEDNSEGQDTQTTDSVDTEGQDTQTTDSVDTEGQDTQTTDSVDTEGQDKQTTDSVDTEGQDKQTTDSVDTEAEEKGSTEDNEPS
ncbi:MAG: S1 RNA-binding domain-containing protein, partial [Candidatus Omnitrophota bacterium]